VTRRRRTEIIARARPEFARGLAETVRGRPDLRIIQEPQAVLVMVKQRESGRNGLFYLGELLVTEARVAIGDQLGLGLIQDDDPDRAAARALDAACIDAAWAAGLSQVAAWLPLLESEAALQAADAAREAGRVAQSRVSFETMDQ
jgi:alpha-D-ribose 1-methylphosphonate 5-triphosphate synthase subunit PhnG